MFRNRVLGVGLCAVLLSILATACSAQFTLTTSLTGTSTAQPGQMFDLTTGATGVTITRFDCRTTATASTAVTYEIWYKTGTYAGSEQTQAAWTQHDTVNTTSGGTAAVTVVMLNTPLVLNPGTVYGMYITTTLSLNGIYDGTGGTFADANLTITAGTSNGFRFGSVFQPRTWNGTIYYSLSGTTGAYTSNTSPSGQVIGAGTTDSAALGVGAFALGSTQAVDSLTVTKTGTLADNEITAAKLWHDANSNGRVDSGESQLGTTQTFTGGVATFAAAPLLSIPSGTQRRFLVTLDLAGTAPVGNTVSLGIASAASITYNPGPDNSTTYPFSGPTLAVVQMVSSLPWLENFDGGSLGGNIIVRSGAGSYPTGTAVGAVPTLTTLSGVGQFSRDAGPAGAAAPISAPNVGHWLFNTATNGAVALDMYFNLSALSFSDWPEIAFSWQDSSIDATAGTSGIFLSDDGGLTWKQMAYRFNWGMTPENTWRNERIALTPLVQAAGMTYSSAFIVRLQIAETGSTTVPDHAEIDDFRIEMPVDVRLNAAVAPHHMGAAAGDTNVVLGAVSALAVNSTQTFSSVTLTRLGTLTDADIAAVRLWRDANADGAWDAGDTQLGTTQTFSGGLATFTGTPLTTVNPAVTALFFITCDLTGTAPAGGTFGVSVNAASDISVAPGPLVATFPLNSFVQTVILRDNALPTVATPWLENFDGATLLSNSNLVAAAGVYPSASTAGGAITPMLATRAGAIARQTTFSGNNPFSAPNMLSYDPLTSVTGVFAAAAADFHFDLSRFNAGADSVEFEFRYNPDGLDSTVLNAVFVSTDGGLTWDRCLFKLPTTPANTWTLFNVNLTSALIAAGKNFTSKMVLRVQMGDDLAGATGDFVNIDDVRLFLTPQALVQAPLAVATPDVVGPGATDIPVLGMTLMAINSTQDISNLTLTKTGMGPDSDIAQVRLFEDTNSTGIFDTGDTQVGTAQTVSGGVVSFSGSPLLSLTTNTTRTIFAVADIVTSPQGGPDFRFSLMSAAGITTNPGSIQGTFPTNGISFSVVVPTSTLPYTCDFDAAVGNLGFKKDPGAYPTATVLNQVPATGNSVNRANPLITGTQGTATPLSGANMGTFTWNNASRAACAMDFHFNLSAMDQNDLLRFSFSFYDNGLDPSVTLADPFNWVFISTDGGATWLRNVLLLDNNIPAGWVNLTFDLTDVIYSAGGTFTNGVVVRLQLNDDDDADFGHIENVTLEMLQDIELSRGTTVFANNGTDVAGNVLAGTAVQLDYDIANAAVAGSPDLNLTGTPAVQFTGVTNCSVTLLTAPSLTTLSAGQSTAFSIEVTPTSGGVFLFSMDIPSDDPDEPIHHIIIFGTGIEPEIDVQRPAGTSIPTGSTDNIGPTAAGTDTTFTYYIVNGGTSSLTLTGTPLVDVQSQVNCTATVTQQPTSATLAAPGVAPFVVQVNPQLGAFSYSLVIDSDDLSEPTYTINVSGNGTTTPEIDIQRVTGTSIPEGSADNVGTIDPGTAVLFTYTVLNTGNAQLNLTGTPAVQVSGATNCTVTVTAMPAATVGAGLSTTFTVEVTAPSQGSFGVVITVTNNDPNESNYQFTLSGFATTLGGGGGGGGDSGGGCSTETSGSPWLLLLSFVAAAVCGIRMRRSHP